MLQQLLESSQNEAFAQLVELSGSRAGVQVRGVSFNSDRACFVQNAALLDAWHKFKVEVDALIRVPTYEPNNTRVCFARRKRELRIGAAQAIHFEKRKNICRKALLQEILERD